MERICGDIFFEEFRGVTDVSVFSCIFEENLTEMSISDIERLIGQSNSNIEQFIAHLEEMIYSEPSHDLRQFKKKVECILRDSASVKKFGGVF